MAKRDKLTQKQRRQVAQKRRQKLKKDKTLPPLDSLSAPKEGLLISRFGEQADILDLADHKEYRCYLRQNLGSPVSGDRVRFRLADNQQGVVEAIENRVSLLQRPSPHQGLKPVVANISQIFIVTAPLPDFSSVLLDRYLVAVADAQIPVQIVVNKWDLMEEISRQGIQEQLSIYQHLGYSVLLLSAQSGKGIDQLKQQSKSQQSILVGQSGVGKSSIINQLFPEQDSLINSVSEISRLGQHTTTASRLFVFDMAKEATADTCDTMLNNELVVTEKQAKQPGFIIDSPGIREFGLWHMDRYTIANGFIEFRDYIGSCKFRDCLHIDEPGCEIIQAVKEQKISEQRWTNYCKIIADPGK